MLWEFRNVVEILPNSFLVSEANKTALRVCVGEWPKQSTRTGAERGKSVAFRESRRATLTHTHTHTGTVGKPVPAQNCTCRRRSLRPTPLKTPLPSQPHPLRPTLPRSAARFLLFFVRCGETQWICCKFGWNYATHTAAVIPTPCRVGVGVS